MMLSEFPAELQQLLAKAGVTDAASLQQVLANNPALREQVADLGETPTGQQLRGFIAAWQQMQRDRQPPLVQAIQAFVNAPDEATARRVFDERRDLLQPYEAQRLIDTLAAQASAEYRPSLAARAELLRRLRGGAPEVSPMPEQTLVLAASGNLQQLNQTLISHSAYAIQGGTATVYNTTNIYSLPRQWQRPFPPRLTRQYLVERHADIEHLRKLLQEHGRAANRPPTVGIYGMAGVGKTMLAQLLAHRLNNDYLDGVIWERLGPDVRTADQVQEILNRWARNAISIEFNPNHPMRFEPDAVRTLLSEHSRLLIILDDVWSKAALKPLLDVIPAEAHLLITTRSRQLVIQMDIQEHQLDVLKDEEARELVVKRLRWGNAIPDHARHWVDELITAVGRHTLALDVALGLLRLRGNATAWASEAHHIITAIKSGADFADLNLGADDREHHVELVLRYSYDHALDEEGRRCFRLLGAFASSADFSTAQAAALWQCDEETARSRLNDFVNRSLLNRSDSDDDHWQQHPLLSGYARALLRRAGEYEAAAAHHAQIFATAMKEADDRQQFYTMKPYIPQLRHAFSWVIVNDLEQALDLIGHCARLQQTFELGAERLQWCEQALQQAQRRGTTNIIAHAQGSLGNALQHAATLPGEDRAARLHAALAAYDEALRFRTAATVPLAYAGTQTNRRNCLQALATLPGEDRAARLHAALAAYWDAVQIFDRYQHAEYLAITRRALQQMRTQLGDEFVRLWEALFAEPLPEWLADPFTSLLNTLLQVRDEQELVAFWQQVPTELEDWLIAAGEALLEQARQNGDEQLVQALGQRLEDFRQLCADQRARAADPRRQRFQAALQAYVAAVQAAEADEADVARWQAVINAGEALRDPDLRGLEEVDWSALHAHLAHNYNQLGNALFASGDAAAALAAYERAVELQPDEAIYWRNRTAALIALGRLSDAAAGLERARALDPTAPRLAELEAQLAQAHRQASSATEATDEQ